MEEALEHAETAQFIGLPTASPRSNRYDGDKAGHALTFKLDHSMGADQYNAGFWVFSGRQALSSRYAALRRYL
jgi:hypothetical protein